MLQKLFGKSSSQASRLAEQGNVALENGKIQNAIDYFNKAIEIDSKMAAVYINRGFAYFLKGDFGQAIGDTTRAIELNPEIVEAYGLRGDSYFQEKNYDHAIMDFSKAIELNPKSAGAYRKRASVFYATGELSRAIEDATKAIENNPAHIDAYGVRGDSYFQNENFDVAIADYSKAIELNPQLAGAYRKRAAVYHVKGQLLRAIDDYETYIRVAPKAPDRANIQATIDYLNTHGAKDGDVDFSPRMPQVDEDRLNEEILKVAQSMATDQIKRQLVIITPGRLIKTSDPLPPRETLAPEFVSILEGIAPSSQQWNIIAIGMTEFRAFNASPNTSVPFLDLIHGFIQIGHAVILFEGHPSGFTQMCHNRDLLVVDSEMVPFLQTDWLEVAKSTMRNPNVLKVNRKGLTVKGNEML